MNKHLHRLVFDRSRGFCIAVAETVAAIGKSASGERRSRGPRACVAAGLAAVAFAAQGQGLPAGATVVKGAATIGVAGGNMTVNQSTPRLVTDWKSFSIGAGNSVRFVQPSSSAVALNRVTGNDPSSIFGSLVANGHVYLQNANGVYFAPGAQVSVGSLVATALEVDVGEFMLGKLRLSGGSPGTGSVDNAGSIVAAPGGHVVLAGPVVSNSGSIATPGGTSALVAGNAVEVDPLGSGLLSIRVPAAAVQARLAQTGSISADGGAVLLAAAASDAALRTVMQVGGVVRARSIESREGQIVLSGGPSGDVLVDGRLDASAGAGGHGGTIKVLGERVGLIGNARLDASGGAGGGTVLVGGNWQGKGSEANASATYVGSGVVLDASATSQGDGGTVVVWSDGHTTYRGQTHARGGANGGDGGKVEVSGKATLDFQGGADLTAARGKTGSLLLDPGFLTVGTVADLNGDSTQGDDLVDNIFAADFGTAPSQITATRVATLLNTADVTLQSQFAINFTAPLTVPAGGAASTLSLQTGDLTIGAPMTLNNASLTASTTATFTTQQITVNAAVTSNNSVFLTSPRITLNAPLTGTNVSLTSGAVSQSAAGTVSATNLALTGSGLFDLSLAPNQVRNLTMANLDFLVVNLTVTNPPGVPLSIDGSANGLVLATTNTDVVQPPGGAINIVDGGEGVSFAISTTGSGNVSLANAANDISGDVAFNVAGNMVLRSANSFRARGTATGDVTLVAGGIFNLDGNISGRNIDITGAGFQAVDTLLLPVPGGRFLIRSSDFTQDNFNSPVFGVDQTDINFLVLGGFSGTVPTTGNGFFTNRTGTITPPNTDNPPVTKVYDGTPGFAFLQTGPTATGTLQGIVGGPGPIPFALTDYRITGSGTFTDKNAGIDKGHTVGSSTDTLALVASAEGNITFFGMRFAGYTRAPGVHSPGAPGNAVSEITSRPITAIGLDGVDRVYNGGTAVGVNASGASLTGTIGGDVVGLVATGATGTLADKNVGTNKPVAVGGLSLAGADAGNYSVSAAPGATATITPLGITSSGFTGVDRVYDATTVVAVDASDAALTGVIGSDSVAIAGATGSVANKNVGTAKPVTVGGITLSGVDAGNYSVTDTGGAVVTITPRPITSTGLDGVDRVYDGTTAVAINAGGGGLVGVLGGDSVGIVTGGASGSVANKNVGAAKPVTIVGVGLNGVDAGNYTVSDASAATVAITARPISATGFDGGDRVYNGGTAVGVDSSGASLTGTIGGDAVSLVATGATGTLADKNVGTDKPVTVGGLSLAGADAGNYTVSAAAGATATITPRPITSTGLDGVDRDYDGTTTVAINGASGSLVGVLGGDVVGIATGGATGTMADKNVGAAKPISIAGVALNGTDADNYTVSDASTATVAIAPRPITAIGLDGVDRVYNGTTAVGVNTSGANLAGTIGGDVVSLVASGATGTLADKNVGTDKPVTVGGLGLAGADAGNYTVSAAAGATATITPLGIASSGFSGIDRVYDGTTVVAVNGSAATLTGVVAGDSVAVAGGTGSVANKNVGTAKPVVVGGVTLSGIDAGNYTASDTGGAFVTITPLGITSTGITGVDRTYDGTTAVAVDTGAAALNGTIAGDSVTLVASAATGTMANKNVGIDKPVTVGGLALAGSDAGNYTLADASNATVDIAALVLTARGVTATDRVVDGTTTVQIDASAATVTGVLPGDTIGIDPTGATGSVANPDPGASKPVRVAGILLTGPDAGNYAIGPVPVSPSGGPLTVAILTVDQGNFEDIRFTKYLQAVSDAQEPFRRAMAEALASGFGKENIRKQLQRGLVFETGLAAPAVDSIEPAARPPSCTPPGGTDLHCGK